MRRSSLLTVGEGALVVLVVLVGASLPEPYLAGDVIAARYTPRCTDGGDPLATATPWCGAVLGDTRNTRGEPWLVRHPTDPDTLIVITNAHSAPLGAPEPPAEEDPDPVGNLQDEINETLGQPPPDEPLPPATPCHDFGVCMHVSADRGRTWEPRALPRHIEAPMAADGVAVFDADAVLHVVALASNGAPIAHMTTPDLGRTWSTPNVISAQGPEDRPWISRNDAGDLVVTWQTIDATPTTHAAWSDDGGQTWTPFADFAPTCNLQSPALPLAGRAFLVACLDADAFQVEVHRLAVNAPTARVATLPGTYSIPILGADASGRIVSASLAPAPLFSATIIARASDDDGKTWNDPVDLLAVTSMDDDWDWFWLSWAAVDADGILHALIAGGRGESCYNQACAETSPRRQVFWIAVDPTTGDRVGQARLDDRLETQGALETSPAYDDYHHLLAVEEGGVLAAWGHDQRVAVAWMAPTPAPTR